jgi:copper chaperone
MTQEIAQTFQGHAPDIHCEGCANAIKRSVGALPGVQKVEVDIPGKNVAVQYNPAQLSDLDIRARLEKAGFPVP